MNCVSRTAAFFAAGFLAYPALAGAFSSGRANSIPGAPDAAIPGFVGPAGNGSTASPNTLNSIFQTWASGWVDYLPTPDVSPAWRDPSVITGPVTGDHFDVVSLGDLTASQLAAGEPPGRITATFFSGISDGDGADFAIFENAFGTDTSVFAELAFVEVSSDGVHFARFSPTSTNPPPGALGFVDPTNIHHLAGKHVNAFGQSWGTPFDLSALANHPLVGDGLVDLLSIRFIRLIDIPGNGDQLDSDGAPIHDSWPTTDSGGFDLHAIGVIHPEFAPGDANLDGKVDTLDFNILAAHFGLSDEAMWIHGDFNSDTQVTSTDFGILVGHYGQGVVVASALGEAIPEPSLVMPMLAGLIVCRRSFH